MKSILITLSFTIIHLFSFSQLSGVYTIGNSPNNTYNFNSFSAAVDSLQQVGVSGPVVFKVDSGTYIEQVVIPHINNSNSVNTITFESLSGDSTDVVLKYYFQNQKGFVLVFDSTSYVSFNKFTLKAEGIGFGQDSTGVININYYSSYIDICNNRIIGGVVGDSKFTNLVSYGNWIKVHNNRLLYGSSSIYFNNGEISNNQIIDFWLFAICVFSDSSYIISNHIETNNFSVSSMGIFVYSSHFVYIYGNKIINVNTGIYGFDNLNLPIRNNFISINRPGFNNTVLKLFYLGIAQFHYNTVNMGSGDTNIVFNFIESWAFASNNIFNVDTGIFLKSTINIGTPTTIYDYNVIHINSGYYSISPSSNTTSLAALKTFGVCPNCVDTVPNFVSPSDLHLSSNHLAGIGNTTFANYYWTTNPIPPIIRDIDGNIRDMNNVTPGADDFLINGKDIEPIAILSPLDTLTIPTTDSICIVVYNCGTDSVVNYKLQIDIDTLSSIIHTINHTLFPGDYDTLHFAPFPSYSSANNISAKTIHYQDIDITNDSISKSIFLNYLDIGISKIILPYDTLLNPQSAVTIKIINVGNLAVDSIPISYTFHGFTYFDTSFSALDIMDTVLFTFGQQINNGNSDSIICITIDVLGDLNINNDFLCKSYVYGGLSTDFPINNKSYINISPNPASDYINLTSDLLRNSNLWLFNSEGKQLDLTYFIIKDDDSNVKIDVSSLSNGIYYLKIENDGISKTAKFIILK